MKIRCNKCGKVMDIGSNAGITFYLEQGEIVCRNCGEVIKIREDRRC